MDWYGWLYNNTPNWMHTDWWFGGSQPPESSGSNNGQPFGPNAPEGWLDPDTGEYVNNAVVLSQEKTKRTKTWLYIIAAVLGVSLLLKFSNLLPKFK